MKLKILQLKNLDKYGFMSFDFAKKHGFNLDDYKIVWEENIDADISLDDLFTRFNIDRPYGFNGHSLSVSDIIDLEGDKYYCDSAGWVDLKTEKNI